MSGKWLQHCQDQSCSCLGVPQLASKGLCSYPQCFVLFWTFLWPCLGCKRSFLGCVSGFSPANRHLQGRGAGAVSRLSWPMWTSRKSGVRNVNNWTWNWKRRWRVMFIFPSGTGLRITTPLPASTSIHSSNSKGQMKISKQEKWSPPRPPWLFIISQFFLWSSSRPAFQPVEQWASWPAGWRAQPGSQLAGSPS